MHTTSHTASTPALTRRTALTAAGIAAGSLLAAGSTGHAAARAQASEAGAGAQAYTAGTYTAVGQGRRGPVEVRVTFTDDAIESVEIGKHDETDVIAASAFELIPAAIVDGQTLNVDAIAGATFTSSAILDAVADCVAQAGASAEALEAAAPAPATTAVTAGTYQGRAHGHHSDVVVEVVLGGDAIESVSVVEDGETFNLSDAATQTLPQLIVDNQSFNVDTVAGATYTSRALEAAVQDCIAQAGGIEAVRGFGARVRTPYEPGEQQVVDTDVVVVGSGMAGIAAALSAQENGARVALVEKLPFWGGVSQTVRGYFAIATDNSEEAVNDFYEYGLNAWCGVMKGDVEFDGYPDRDMLRTLAANSWASTQWLSEQGTALQWSTEPYIYHMQPEYYRMDAHFDDTNVREPDLVGTNFKTLIEKFEANGGEVYLNAPMTQILREDGTVTGILAEGRGGSYRFNAKAVVLCAGGFGASEAAIAAYAPAYAGESINNVTLPSNTGDGMMLAQEVGAAVYDDAYMSGQNGHTLVDDHAMMHPYQDHLTPMSCIYVNKQGLRVNSEDPIKYTPGTSYADAHGEDFYWAVCNEAVASLDTKVKILQEDLSSDTRYVDVLEEQLDSGNERFHKADTLAELANEIGMIPNVLRYTVNRYNGFCTNSVDEDFAKSADYLKAMEEGPWYAVKCIMKYFCTIGGVVTNPNAQVLDTDGQPIPGLFAAGENSNHGFFNLFYNGARSMTVCLVMGKIAGEQAAKLV